MIYKPSFLKRTANTNFEMAIKEMNDTQKTLTMKLFKHVSCREQILVQILFQKSLLVT